MSLYRHTPEELAAASPEERAAAAAVILETLGNGRQPFPLFKELRRMVVMSTVELVPLRHARGNRGAQVLLGLRGTGPEEPWWGGQLNLPGSVILPSEPIKDRHDLESPSDRILDQEFHNSVRRISRVHEFDHGFVTGDSGRENKRWGWTIVSLTQGYEAAEGGDFYDVQEILNDPPENLVESHRDTLAAGYEDYLRFQSA